MKRIFAGLILFMSLLCLSGCQKIPEKLSIAGTAMGTIVQETIYATDSDAGRICAQEILELVDALEKESLSWREPGAEVAELNETAGMTEGYILSEQMMADLGQIWQVSEKSKGALDITVGQVTRLWNLDKWAVADRQTWKNFHEPEASILQERLENTGYNKVLLKDSSIYLPQDMSLDLGAVGKGIACDRIGEYLSEQEDITGAVVSVGGSIVTYGTKPDGKPWQVAIAHPRETGTYLGTLKLKGEWFVSTSGDYERYIEKDGKRYHHIMNPATGWPVDNEVCSVTILCENGLLSDALSTACFVLGVEDGMKLAKEFQVEALFVTRELEIVMTEGMQKYFEVAQ